MRIKEGLEVHHMKIHMNIVTMKGLVLAEEVMINIQDIVMMKEEVLDMIKKVDSIMITKEVPLVQKLSMIGVERIDLEMAGKWKTEG
jgi:adenylosuccinate lyase